VAVEGGDSPDSGLLAEENFAIKSLLEVDLDKSTATFPLHKGFGPDGTTPVWFVITESSDFGLAHDLNVNFAPKLANMSIDCPTCVQETTLMTSAGNKFSEAPVNFVGIPDFTPARILTPGPAGFPASVRSQDGHQHRPCEDDGRAAYDPRLRFRPKDPLHQHRSIGPGRGRARAGHLRATPQSRAIPRGDDFLGSARERIFTFTNGQTGKDNK